MDSSIWVIILFAIMAILSDKLGKKPPKRMPPFPPRDVDRTLPPPMPEPWGKAERGEKNVPFEIPDIKGAPLPQGMIPAMRPELCRLPCQTANRAMRRIRQCRILQCHILLAPMRLRRILAHRGEMLFMAQASYRAIRLPTGALPPSTEIRKQAILLRL